MSGGGGSGPIKDIMANPARPQGGPAYSAPQPSTPVQTGPTTGGPGIGPMNHMVQPEPIRPMALPYQPTPIGQEPPPGSTGMAGLSSTGMAGLSSAIGSTTPAFQPPAPATQPYTYQPYQSYSQPQQPYSNYYQPQQSRQNYSQPQQGGINQSFSQQYNPNQQQFMNDIQNVLQQLLSRFGQNR